MKARLWLLVPGMIAGLIAGAAAQTATVYVKADGTSLRSGAQLGGPTVAELAAGTQLTVLEQERLRLRVRTADGREGYVATRQVQESRPDDGNRGLSGLVRDDRSASELRTAASGRGLSEEARLLAATEAISERAVRDTETMEEVAARITPQDVDAFLREGGMNP